MLKAIKEEISKNEFFLVTDKINRKTPNMAAVRAKFTSNPDLEN